MFTHLRKHKPATATLIAATLIAIGCLHYSQEPGPAGTVAAVGTLCSILVAACAAMALLAE